ncbi:MAG TPA: FHA domain-containing protein [Nannocystis exedens]|nr:FHA domain-containing protein [Nannocystis exedens]
MGAGDKTTRHPVPTRSPKPTCPWLCVLEGCSAGQYLRLDRAEILIGKDPAADLVLIDSGVSRRHVKIVRAGDGIYNLIDLNSTNGVLVNGVRVDLTILREHDRVQIGPETRLLFTYDEAEVRRQTHEPLAPLHLSPRQLEVAKLVCKGLTNAEIAAALGIRARTVTSHLDHIYNRLDIGSRSELAIALVKRGLA